MRPRPPKRHRREPEPYQRYRQSLQQRWRPLILERDKHRCRACKAKDALEVAHITDCVAFVKAAGDHRAVTFSYRWDNLYTLCNACHKASHRFRLSPEDLTRRLEVTRIEEQLRRLRGWSGPFAVLPPHMVPAAARAGARFHDRMRITPLMPFPTYPKYAADGGLVFDDEEPAAGQATLF